jgi:transposase
MSISAKSDIDVLLSALKQLLVEGRVDEALEQVASLLRQMREQNNALQLRLGKLLRLRFGRTSEKVSGQQLALFLEQLGHLTQAAPTPPPQTGSAPPDVGELPRPTPPPRKGHGRKPLPPSLPREENILSPSEKERVCGTCGQQKSSLGYERSEVLEFIPARFKVVVNAREKLACRACGDGVVIGPVADKVIDSGLPGPGLLANVLVAKYAEHQPLTRQSETYKRAGVELRPSTLADWVGASTELLAPLAQRILQHALASHVLQSDDTGLKVLDRDAPHGIKRGHVWIYVGDAKWAAFVYTPDWKGEGPQSVLAERKGWLLVDGYAGYDALFQGEAATAVEVGCWSHARRYYIETLEKGDIRAAVPVDLIGQLFAIERQATTAGLSPDERLAWRNQYSRPVLAQLGQWMNTMSAGEPPKSPLAGAIGYSVRRWVALGRFLEDGRLPLENNLSERLLRPVAVGRKNYLFAGSDKGAERACIAYTLLGTCKLNGVEPWAYLCDVLSKLAAGWPHSRLDELLPPYWAAQHQAQQQAHAASLPATPG